MQTWIVDWLKPRTAPWGIEKMCLRDLEQIERSTENGFRRDGEACEGSTV